MTSDLYNNDPDLTILIKDDLVSSNIIKRNNEDNSRIHRLLKEILIKGVTVENLAAVLLGTGSNLQERINSLSNVKIKDSGYDKR